MKVVDLKTIPGENVESTIMTPGPVTWQTALQPPDSNIEICQINFGKGVRNKLHTHTDEQILIITAGKGWVATETEKVVVEPGCIVHFAPGEKHWHGALPDSEFSHIFIRLSGTKTTQFEE